MACLVSLGRLRTEMVRGTSFAGSKVLRRLPPHLSALQVLFFWYVSGCTLTQNSHSEGIDVLNPEPAAIDVG